jgi:hypothetical protein
MDVQANINACLLRRMPDIHHRRLQQVGHRNRFDIVQVIQRVQTRQREELIHQPGCAVDTRMQLRQRFSCACGSSCESCATSVCTFSAASGLRSSWAASDVKRRSRVIISWVRAKR